MRKLLLLFLFISALFSCERYKYPDSKVWKHGVYSKLEAHDLEGVFDGLEVDVIYSPEKNDIYVGRIVADTSKNQTLDDWFSVLEKPKKMSFWIDFKNFSADNANAALDVLDVIMKKYKIQNKSFIESKDVNALKIAKERGYYTMLWVENLYYWKNRKHKDTITVMRKIRNKIDELQPDAISCEYTMFPLLCDTFPEQNIHFWDTPKEYSPENVEFTKKLCNNKSVRVVLVDYPEPIDY